MSSLISLDPERPAWHKVSSSLKPPQLTGKASSNNFSTLIESGGIVGFLVPSLGVSFLGTVSLFKLNHYNCLPQPLPDSLESGTKISGILGYTITCKLKLNLSDTSRSKLRSIPSVQIKLNSSFQAHIKSVKLSHATQPEELHIQPKGKIPQPTIVRSRRNDNLGK